MTSAVVFAYGEVGARCLQVLLRQGVQIDAVITHEDDPAELRWFASVADTARASQVPVLAPADPNTPSLIDRLARQRPDFLFSFHYRRLLCEQLLAAARRGALNMHGSLLPKYRGCSPVNWAIIHGEAETGASLHYMRVKADAGPIVGQERVPILINDTALQVYMKVAAAAERLLERCLPDLMAGCIEPVEQDLPGGSYFGRRCPQDGWIQWDRPALEIHNLIRAVAPPYPGAFGECGGRTLHLLGSLYRAEPAQHPQSAPCLYVDNDRMQLDCVDGRRISLTALEVDSVPLAPAAWLARHGRAPLHLRPASLARSAS
jgi:methionyl-tRNA formyltransferase